ncbi:hypothetical protein VTN96DRAFT_4011 [Rasamsonia emersonii]
MGRDLAAIIIMLDGHSIGRLSPLEEFGKGLGMRLSLDQAKWARGASASRDASLAYRSPIWQEPQECFDGVVCGSRSLSGVFTALVIACAATAQGALQVHAWTAGEALPACGCTPRPWVFAATSMTGRAGSAAAANQARRGGRGAGQAPASGHDWQEGAPSSVAVASPLVSLVWPIPRVTDQSSLSRRPA